MRACAGAVVFVALILLLALGIHLLPAEAQPAGRVFRVGLLLFADRQATPYAVLLRERLRDLGYREGHEIIFEERFLAGQPERLPELAADLVRRPVDVIVTRYDGETRAAKGATDSIPIVMLEAVDPVGNGFVASLAQPGGNVTGLTFDAGFEVASKRIEILKEAIPKLKSVGFLFNPEFPGMAGYVRVWKATTASLGLESQAFAVRESKDIRAALTSIKQARPGALFVGGGFSVSVDDRQRIVDFTIESRLPAMVLSAAWMKLGGLVAYLPSDRDRARRGAAFIDKILKGAKPADLPVEQPTKFELVINMKTAKALGLTIPQSLLLRADEIIQDARMGGAMQKPLLAWGLIVLGLVIVVLSGLADALGIGQHPGFGWTQAVGMAVGAAIAIRGIYWRRRLRATRST